MTIEIIKQGRLPEEKRWGFRCRNCGTEFVAHKADGHYFNDQRDGEGLSVQCPLCSKQVTSQQEHKDPNQSARPWDMPKPSTRGWQDRVIERFDPHAR